MLILTVTAILHEHAVNRQLRDCRIPGPCISTLQNVYPLVSPTHNVHSIRKRHRRWFSQRRHQYCSLPVFRWRRWNRRHAVSCQRWAMPSRSPVHRPTQGLLLRPVAAGFGDMIRRQTLHLQLSWMYAGRRRTRYPRFMAGSSSLSDTSLEVIYHVE